ncbi:molybdenum cofactor guanylyltransferase MobA [Falsigemmobacter faecalis]|uniref:Molybdenum cofactor guanylyltransferase n=1 Tax=Falsigemmobacter faecalis TaxID=2488730 RepID=A0A3P3DVK9_9RHOB|nr:molybdenum cofactor guanylyltransferase MobA [Falsigemmobacter faecalis]RRH78205.1 molybdenum cofactor guanylyltransferase MobA [Falsigemmobacter faecalis]
MSKPLGVILAGGLARRMGGGDKGLLDLGGQTILGEVIARLAPQCAGLVLNANGQTGRFSGFGLPVIPDGIPGFPGPLAGVLAGMERAADLGLSHILTAAADTPFMPRDLGARLSAALSPGRPIALAATREGERLIRQPVFGLWPVALRGDLRQAIEGGLSKIVLWTDRHGTALAEFDPGPPHPFFNVNTPEDLAEARAIWQKND